MAAAMRLLLELVPNGASLLGRGRRRLRTQAAHGAGDFVRHRQAVGANGFSVAFKHCLAVEVRKNFLIKRWAWQATVMELMLPVSLMLLMVAMRLAVKREEVTQMSYVGSEENNPTWFSLRNVSEDIGEKLGPATMATFKRQAVRSVLHRGRSLRRCCSWPSGRLADILGGALLGGQVCHDGCLRQVPAGCLQPR